MIIITKDFVKSLMIEYLYATRLIGRNQFQIKRYQSMPHFPSIPHLSSVPRFFKRAAFFDDFSFVKTLRSSFHLFYTLIYIVSIVSSKFVAQSFRRFHEERFSSYTILYF